MKVFITASAETCMVCSHCPEDAEPPSEACVACIQNPDHTGEVIQFLMHEGTAYAVVLIKDQFWLADINDLRYIKELV